MNFQIFSKNWPPENERESKQVNGSTRDPGWKLPEKERPDRNPASCKIQYPMKNRDKDAIPFLKIKHFPKIIFAFSLKNEKVVHFKHNF